MTNAGIVRIQWNKLLGRGTARVQGRALPHLEGASVLITGAGGSIGSALTRTILKAGADRIVLLDSSEQALYRLTSEIASCGRVFPVLGSILNEALLDDVFSRYAPAFIFHTAAYKHLPLLEMQPFAAIENNTIGTNVLAKAAEKFRAVRLIAVSTDKAVNPTSIMGASKRLAELVVAALANGRTKMTTVRLGNVLGSDGSVAPRFVDQIERGGPITITDSLATRYFFTMEETVDLILLGSTAQAENAVLIPEEPAPTSVLALAEILIRALGADPGRIRIEYTGLQAGEKLSEQLCYESERQVAKQMEGYRLIPRRPALLDTEDLIVELRRAVRERDFEGLIKAVRRYVPEYYPSAQLQQLFTASAARSQA